MHTFVQFINQTAPQACDHCDRDYKHTYANEYECWIKSNVSDLSQIIERVFFTGRPHSHSQNPQTQQLKQNKPVNIDTNSMAQGTYPEQHVKPKYHVFQAATDLAGVVSVFPHASYICSHGLWWQLKKTGCRKTCGWYLILSTYC